MLELTVQCKCKICKEVVEIKSLPEIRPLYSMMNNETRETPFFAYHHPGFGEDQKLAMGNCPKCGAEYTLNTGVISVVCEAQYVDEEFEIEYQNEPEYVSSQLTFPKWLKLQQHRADIVGDLARQAFHSEGRGREYKKWLDREHPGRPKRATEFEEWVKFLDGADGWLRGFYMAWAEYQLLKGYGKYKADEPEI